MRRFIAPFAAVLVLALSACAPTNTNSTYTSADIGRTASISYGVIVSMRAVQVQGQPTGVGTLGGAAVGAVAGSAIGGRDPRANIVGGIVGAIVGGIAGNAVEHSASGGEARRVLGLAHIPTYVRNIDGPGGLGNVGPYRQHGPQRCWWRTDDAALHRQEPGTSAGWCGEDRTGCGSPG